MLLGFYSLIGYPLPGSFEILNISNANFNLEVTLINITTKDFPVFCCTGTAYLKEIHILRYLVMSSTLVFQLVNLLL